MWRIRLSSVVTRIILLTDYHEPLTTASGETYSPQTPGMGTAQQRTDAAPKNFEVHSFVTSDSITPADVARGLWDGAIVEELVVDYRYPYEAPLEYGKYRVSSITVTGETIFMEVESVSKMLEKPSGESWGGSCRVPVFSQTDGIRGACRLNPDDWHATGQLEVKTSLVSPATNKEFVVVTTAANMGSLGATGWTSLANYGALGKIEFLSGANAGYTTMIQSTAFLVDGPTTYIKVKLQKPTPYDVALNPIPATLTGDYVRLLPGCSKQMLGVNGCAEKFDNAINFQGEPYIPGRDKALEVST